MTKLKMSTIEKMTDEECLKTMSKLFSRVQLSTRLVTESGEDPSKEQNITHEQIIVQCGDKFFASPPQELNWPLQPVPMPKELVN